MGINKKLKWLKLVDEYKHLHKQLGYAKSIGKDSAGDFQLHYEEFCRKRSIDLSKLNADNEDKINKAYGMPPREPSADEKNDSMGNLLAGDTEMEIYKSSNPQKDLSDEDKEIHDMFSRLFKKIATKIHPDKIAADPSLSEFEKERLTKLFQSVTLALDERKYFVLLDIAEDLALEPPKDYEKQTRWLKKETQDLRTQTQREQKTYNYMFSETETEAEKDNVIRQFIYQLFGIHVP